MKKKILLSIAFILVASAAFIGYKVWGTAVKVPEGKYFYIKSGSTLGDVKNMLQEKGVLKNMGWFNRVANWKGYKSIKAGRYEIKKGMSINALVNMLKGGLQSPVNFVITKLRTRESLAKRVGTSLECDSLQMINFLNNNDSLKKYGLDTNTVMSVVIPDTYTYFWNTTPQKVFQKLYDGSQKFWNKERKEKAVSHNLTPLQAITLASIVEEETIIKEDKGKIAGVYMNRIAKNMKLEADPTVKFALKNFGLKRIYNADLKVPSPFNTYYTTGLPPGPICTPSVETIEEVLNSPKTDYLFFVANSDYSGYHIFTSSYTDHLKYAAILHKEMNRRDSLKKAQLPPAVK
jgi:UPF0755 protein